MVRRKPFIDKKNSTTYNLLYRAKEIDVHGEDTGPDRELIGQRNPTEPGSDASGSTAAAARGASSFPVGHPLSWLQEPPPDVMSPERRSELMGMGFPDDGYDYLKHMRAPGRGGKANLEGAESDAAPSGPSTFIKADTAAATQLEDDVRFFDATQLTIHQAAETEESANDASGGVSVFARQKERARGTEAAEIAALEASLAEMEDEEGDLEDDFIVSATQVAKESPTQGASTATVDHQPAGELHWPDAGSSDDEDSSQCSSQSDWEESQENGSASRPPTSQNGAPQGSIASTYWRPERSDRKNLLATVDEQFEHLALDYDEDDIGDLSEEDESDRRGDRDLASYDAVLNKFLTSSGTSVAVEPSEMRLHGVAYRNAADLANAGRTGSDADVAARATSQAKSIMRGYDDEAGEGPQPVGAYERHQTVQDRWDCESVLSLRSNLDNHPASITEPHSSRRARRQVLGAHKDEPAGYIKLGRSSGIPLGVMGSRRAAFRESGGAQSNGRSQQDEALSEDADSLSGDGAGGGFVAAPRPKGETAEEKRARKAEVKEAKRTARVAKKQMKGMYKQEFARQGRAMAAPSPTIIPMSS